MLMEHAGTENVLTCLYAIYMPKHHLWCKESGSINRYVNNVNMCNTHRPNPVRYDELTPPLFP